MWLGQSSDTVSRSMLSCLFDWFTILIIMFERGTEQMVTVDIVINVHGLMHVIFFIFFVYRQCCDFLVRK